ncbi:class A beta-lactamase-related serine hydrolase [Caproiciproducens sp. NJN-50]|uniref:serine hydrolase domain-containing protein n=1 Tax=Acutalibacteraceae TaxID=3082771 RepID=UPI000FFE20A8|nr:MULTISPECIES: serine hydrolase domain-containing protein [Acutalibacteraceae]QAT51023.1 class A beta-lactamase-related serine hydrolase [Caproiciproducens sp. NJN-50]
MKESILDGFRLTAAEQELHVYGIRVERSSGESVTHFWRSNDPVNLYSASKTFTSLAVGMCLEDGRFSLSDRVLDFFPEYRGIAAPGSEAITLRDLLHMASGKLHFWFGELDGRKMEDDWAELFFRVPVTKQPGVQFFYSNACCYMLGRTVEKVTGKNVRDFLVPRLFVPLGIENPQWHADPQGHTLCATQFFLTLDEFSCLGRLLLHHGVWDGKRLVSEEYLKNMSADSIPSGWDGCEEPECLAGYGYQVWLCSAPGTWRADGKYGQFCILLPEREAAVTVTAHEEQRPYSIVRAVFDEIAPRL